MNNPFWLKLLLSFFVGGLWVTAASIAGEKLGTKVGGFIAGLPSTIVIALTFVAWTEGVQQAFQATTIMPFAFSVNALYLVTYAALARKTCTLGIIGALSVWFALQTLLAVLQIDNLVLAIAVWFLILVASYEVLQTSLHIRSHESVSLKYAPAQVAWRAGFGGTAVVAAILMSRIGGPSWGGVFSAFPAILTSTLIITSHSVNVEFSRSLTTPLMLSGVITPVVYGMVFRYAVMSFSLLAASAVAYGTSLVSAFLTFLFVQRIL